MPSMETYRKLHNGVNVGQEHKRLSDCIMNETWWNDIASRKAYLFDYWHDNDKTRLNDFNPKDNPYAEVVDIKYIAHASQSYNNDQNTFHLQLRPGFKCENEAFCNYNKVFKEYYDATFPIGLYALIPDEQGIYNRWLIVDKANYNDTAFPTFEILKCDKIIQYVNTERKCIEVAGVLQNQNSYNSGIWSG